jgi:hypothetical protein
VPRRPFIPESRISPVPPVGYSLEHIAPRYWLRVNNAPPMLENSASRAGGRDVKPAMCSIHAVLAKKFVG